MTKAERMSDLYKNVCIGLLTIIGAITSTFTCWIAYNTSSNTTNIASLHQVVKNNVEDIKENRSDIKKISLKTN